MSNSLPPDCLRLYFDTRAQVAPELVADLISAVCEDLRKLGFDDLELHKAGRGSTEIELIAKAKAEIDLKKARVQLAAERLKLGVIGAGAAASLIGGAILIAEKILDSEPETGESSRELMLDGDASYCAIAVDGLEIRVAREDIDEIVYNDNVNELVSEEPEHTDNSSEERANRKPDAILDLSDEQIRRIRELAAQPETSNHRFSDEDWITFYGPDDDPPTARNVTAIQTKFQRSKGPAVAEEFIGNYHTLGQRHFVYDGKDRKELVGFVSRLPIKNGQRIIVFGSEMVSDDIFPSGILKLRD